MSQQEALFGEPRPLDHDHLGPAQQAVLDELRTYGRLDDDEAGAIVHARRGKHSRDERCDYCAQDGRQVLASLRAHGHTTRRRTGEWTTPGPRARRTDPSTSHEAAAGLGDLRDSQLAVLAIFLGDEGLTDERLLRFYRRVPDLPRQSDSGLRTRRHELVELGLLEDSGVRDVTEAGRNSIVWALTAQGRQVASRHYNPRTAPIGF